MTNRQYLTKNEYAALFLKQKGRCGCGCGERLEQGKVDAEHTIPCYFNPGKPDSLWRRACHKKKTRADKADIAKCKRRRGETGQYKRRMERGGSSIPSPSKEQRQANYQWMKKRKAELKVKEKQ